MSRLDELPPDQRAALSLLLRQHKSYAEVSSLLGIAERAVHDRAHAALAVLAPRQARELTPERRLEIGDYLLGQQPGVAERLKTRTYLSSSEPARAWANEIAAQLAPLAGADLPEVPPALGAAAQRPERVGDLSSSAHAGGASAGGVAAPPALPARSPSSRVGGAVLLAVIVAAVVVAVVLITGGGGGSSDKKASTTASTTAGTTSTAAKTGPTIDNKIALKSPDPKSNSVGVVYVLSEGSKTAFFIQAQHIPASNGFYYAIWLYNSHTSAMPLSKSPAVGSTHSFAGGSALPSNAGDFREIVVSKETSAHPAHPGPVVLHGRFSLH
jgi:archaellin